MPAPNIGSLSRKSTADRLENRLSLSLRRSAHAAEMSHVAVPPAYMRDLEYELLLKYFWRRGMPEATVEDLPIEITPIFRQASGGSQCSGLRVDVVDARGNAICREYSVDLFFDVARQAVAELMDAGILQTEDTYHYELVIDNDDRSSVSTPPDLTGMKFRAEARSDSQPYLVRRIQPLIEQAQPVAQSAGDYLPVFYTAEAIQRAECFARRGAAAQPARETGGALVGTACACPDTGEFFVVVTDTLEATDAEERPLSLAYTGETWLRLQAVVQAIRSQPTTSTYRFLGQAHGHNFIPHDSAPPCELCATAKVCSRTSVFASVDDRIWTQSVFAGTPYALCHIFGLNARHEKVHALYSLVDNCLTQRGFYIIPKFDPAGEP